jgi:hypothetical protein
MGRGRELEGERLGLGMSTNQWMRVCVEKLWPLHGIYDFTIIDSIDSLESVSPSNIHFPSSAYFLASGIAALITSHNICPSETTI